MASLDRVRTPASIWRHPAGPWLVWTGVLAAFSPVVLDLGQHLGAHPWARTTIVFPWLAWVAAREDQGRQGGESKRIIWICLLFALAIELAAIGGDVLRLGRVALVIGVIGIVCGAGWARPTAALVFVWAIPIPNSVVEMFSPGLESVWCTVAAGMIPGLGFEMAAGAPALVVGEARLAMTPADGGLALGYGLAGLGWFQSVVMGGTGMEAVGRAIRWGLLALPAQLGIILLAGSWVAVSGTTGLGSRVLGETGWILVLAIGGLLSVRALRGGVFDRAEGATC